MGVTGRMLPSSAPGQMNQPLRRHVRHPIEAALLVRGIGSTIANGHRGHCTDLSEAGAGCVIAGDWLPGQVVTMELNLPGTGEPVLLSARVCHRSETRCGFEFLAPSEQALNLLRQLFPKA